VNVTVNSRSHAASECVSRTRRNLVSLNVFECRTLASISWVCPAQQSAAASSANRRSAHRRHTNHGQSVMTAVCMCPTQMTGCPPRPLCSCCHHVGTWSSNIGVTNTGTSNVLVNWSLKIVTYWHPDCWKFRDFTTN